MNLSDNVAYLRHIHEVEGVGRYQNNERVRRREKNRIYQVSALEYGCDRGKRKYY